MNQQPMTPQELAAILARGERTTQTRTQTKPFLDQIAASLANEVGPLVDDVGTKSQSDARKIQFIDRAYFYFAPDLKGTYFPLLCVYLFPGQLWWGLHAWGKESYAKNVSEALQDLNLASGDEIQEGTGAFHADEAWGTGSYVSVGRQLTPDEIAEQQDTIELAQEIAGDLADWWRRLQPHLLTLRERLGFTEETAAPDYPMAARLKQWEEEVTNPDHPNHFHAELDWPAEHYAAIMELVEKLRESPDSFTREDVIEFFGQLNSGVRMKNMVADNNPLPDLRANLLELLDGEGEPAERIRAAAGAVDYAGENMLGELYGWVHAKEAPLFNRCATDALRYLGYDFDPQNYDAFVAAHEQFKQVYEQQVGQLRPDIPLNLEVDKFYNVIDKVDMKQSAGDGQSFVEPLPVPEPYSEKSFASATYLLPETITEIRDMVRDKCQVIFYGPPGTGKTFVAKELGKLLTGLPDPPPERMEIVQFHPAYGYEDFIEGIRPRSVPAGDDRFVVNYPVEPGAFRRFCRVARDVDSPCVFIIDEINRGNIPRIFGELMLLLEYRDQRVTLPYSGEPFSIPENVYIIGTMNTADRSIALVDFALRRRFHFFRFDADPDLFERWLRANPVDIPYLARLYRRLSQDAIDDANFAIGPSHFMQPDLDETKLERIWRRSIIPYLQEYYFDQPAKAKRWEWNNDFMVTLRGGHHAR